MKKPLGFRLFLILVFASLTLSANEKSRDIEIEKAQQAKAKAYQELLKQLRKKGGTQDQKEAAKKADDTLLPSSRQMVELQHKRLSPQPKAAKSTKSSSLKKPRPAETRQPLPKPTGDPSNDPRPQYELDGSTVPKEVDFNSK